MKHREDQLLLAAMGRAADPERLAGGKTVPFFFDGNGFVVIPENGDLAGIEFEITQGRNLFRVDAEDIILAASAAVCIDRRVKVRNMDLKNRV